MTRPKNPKLVDALDVLLADHQVFYQKLRGYHWNVSGVRFFDLHARFESLYDLAADHVDAIAERIAMLGARPSSTLKRYLAATRLREDETAPSAQDMVRHVLQDLEKLTAWTRELAVVADESGDRGTTALLDGLGDTYEKECWMLRASLES